MTLIGYARCSTTHQDTQAQTDALLAAGVHQDRLFSEYISGAAPFSQRIQLQAAIAACQPGDVLVLPKLDRLGRSTQDCVSRAAELLEAGVHIKTLDGRVDSVALGKMAKLMITLLAAVAEIERDLILERTEEGRRRALAAGEPFGRPRSWKREQAAHVKELVTQGLSHRQVAAKVGLSASTVRRMLQEAS